jgi:hypothetical protein
MELDNQVINDTNADVNNGTGEQFTDREKQYYARIKKLESELKEREAPKTTDNVSDDWRERMELKVEGYNDKEIELLTKMGGRKALEDETVKKFLEVQREEEKSKAKVAMNTSSKSSVETRYTQEQISRMSVKEYEDVLMGRKK